MNLHGRKFLVVDDFESIRKTIKKELILSGAKAVDEASNGEDALKMMHDGHYDAVLSDWNMPKKNGLELLIDIRNDKQLYKTPVMLITAETDRDMVRDAIQHKVNDFLVKPFSLQMLMERVMDLIDGKYATASEILAVLDTPISHEVLGLADELASFENMNVLVIDDSADNLDVIVGCLKGECQLKAANSTKVARKVLEKTNIDLILLDIMMPDEDGYEFCGWLKQQPSFKSIPVLFLTAKDQPDDVAKGLLLGAVDYVTKPVHPVVLKARVATHLRINAQNQMLLKHARMLKRTVKEKEAADRLMRHDLRNPLQAIMFATEQRDMPSDAAELIRNNVQSALDQVDLTLTLARLEKGVQAINRVDVRLQEFVNRFRETMNLLANASHVNIHWDIDFSSNEIVNLDVGLFQNLFCNLIRNAIEASTEGQVVHVKYDSTTKIWSITNPTPVPVGIRDRFFDKYATSGKTNGNGLGTYMAKLIAHAHKGHIKLMNVSHGTIIEVTTGQA